jgi:hypothetical protein
MMHTIIMRAGFLILRSSFGVAAAMTMAAWLVLCACLGPSAVRAEPLSAPEDQVRAVAEADDDDEVQALDINSLDWSQLNVDAYALIHGLEPKPRTATLNAGESLAWSSKDKPNGASDVSVKQKVAPFWDARIGADMTVAREPTTMSELLAEKANGGNPQQSSGSAWAAVTAPGAGPIWDKTAVEARVDPAKDESKLGTSISKQVTITDQTALTLQNGVNVIQQGVVTGPGTAARPTRSYDTGQSAKLSNSETGTSLTAGQTLSTNDDKWLRKIGAEQQLPGGVTVSGSIGETPQGTTNKTISAGYKKSW